MAVRHSWLGVASFLLAAIPACAHVERRGLGLSLHLSADAAKARFEVCMKRECLPANVVEDLEIACEDQYSDFICQKQLSGARECMLHCGKPEQAATERCVEGCARHFSKAERGGQRGEGRVVDLFGDVSKCALKKCAHELERRSKAEAKSRSKETARGIPIDGAPAGGVPAGGVLAGGAPAADSPAGGVPAADALVVGEAVELSDAKGRIHPGEIERANSDGTFDVKLKNGGEAHGVAKGMLRALKVGGAEEGEGGGEVAPQGTLGPDSAVPNSEFVRHSDTTGAIVATTLGVSAVVAAGVAWKWRSSVSAFGTARL